MLLTWNKSKRREDLGFTIENVLVLIRRAIRGRISKSTAETSVESAG
jgi:hypothetical protein